MAFQSKKKHRYETHTVTSTSTSSTTGLTDTCAQMDDVLVLVNLTTLTAGTIAFQVQISMDDGTTWLNHPDAAAAISAMSAIGAAACIVRSPIGSKMRVAFTIVTGPAAFTLVYDFSRRGDIK